MNSKAKYIGITILILFLAIGFAAVTTNLFVNSTTSIGTVKDDFNVVFTEASSANGIVSISQDGLSILYSTHSLQSIGDVSSLSYTVTNNSSQLDASISVSLVDENGNELDSDYFTVVQSVKLPSVVSARTSESGIISIVLTKVSIEDRQYFFKLRINATGVERTSRGEGEIVEVPVEPGVYDEDGYLVMNFDTLVGNYNIDFTQSGGSAEEGYEETSYIKHLLETEPELANVKTFIVPEGTTSIPAYAFYKCETLTSVILPDSVVTINESAFFGCTNLVELKLSNNLKTIKSSAFRDCKSIKTLELPDSLTNISPYSFQNLSSVESIKFPSNFKSIPYNAFTGCSSLKELNLPDSVDYIGSTAFNGCNALEFVRLPASLKKIPSYGFSNCKKLRKVIIPSATTQITNNAFSGDSVLTEVIFEDPYNWTIDNEPLSVEDLSNAETAALYLRSTYKSKNFIKTTE